MESPPEKHKSRVFLGIDPESGGFSYTIIKGRVTGDKDHAVFIKGGTISVKSHLDTREFLRYAREECKVTRLAIESPGQYGGASFESSYLISSALNIGMIVQIAAELGIETRLFPSQVIRKNQYGQGWRYYLFGKKRLSRKEWDKTVKLWLLHGHPIRQYPASSNGNVRDSSAIAFAFYMADRRNDYRTLGCVSPYEYHNYIRSSR